MSEENSLDVFLRDYEQEIGEAPRWPHLAYALYLAARWRREVKEQKDEGTA